MNHKYKKDDILIYNDGAVRFKCQILSTWHLIYKQLYPTYKIEFLEEFVPAGYFKKMVVSEDKLKNSDY